MMSFPGAAAAALAGLPLAWGYFAFCGVGALVIAGSSRSGPRPRSLSRQSAIVGMVGAGALAVGYLLLSLYGGVLESLETLLFGSILGVTRGEVLTLAIVGACAWHSSRSSAVRCSLRPSIARSPRGRVPVGSSRRRSCSCWGSRSRPRRRSRACCWSSRCCSLRRRSRAS